MRRTTVLPAKSLPDDLLEGFERRVRSVEIPANKLPEIMELRAIAREILAHVNWLEEFIHSHGLVINDPATY